MKKERKKTYLCSIIVGAILVAIGILLRIPGGALTTYEGFNGKTTEYYAFSNKYIAIDEYVGGDAYNYIIGASLVAGRTSGVIAAKAVFVVGGLMCICLGQTLKVIQENKDNEEKLQSAAREREAFLENWRRTTRN